MKRKITVIGAGSVGATTAYTAAVKGIASEICMIDINKEKTEGEAMDIRQASPFNAPCDIYAGDYADAKDSDIVIITSGMPRKPGQSRIDLTQINVDIMKDIAGKIVAHAPDAIYIIVSNPVDVMTYVFTKISGIPANRVIGTGTLLDSARLCSRVADHLGVNPHSVDAYVLGEHGDSSFVPWSICKVGPVAMLDYKKFYVNSNQTEINFNMDEIESYMKTSGGQIISKKGATFYAIACSVCNLAEAIFSGAYTVLAVSTLITGEYGITDVCLSIPFVVGPDGIAGKATPVLTKEEMVKLNNSANVLKDVIAQINI